MIGKLATDAHGSIGRGVVGDDQLPIRERLRQDAPDGLGDEIYARCRIAGWKVAVGKVNELLRVVQVEDGGKSLLARAAGASFRVGPQEMAVVGTTDFGHGLTCQHVGNPGRIVGVVMDDAKQRDITLAPGLKPGWPWLK